MRTLIAVTAAALLAPSLAGAGERDRLRDDPQGRAEWNRSIRTDLSGRLLAKHRLDALKHACEMPVDPSMAAAPAGSFERSDTGPSVSPLATFPGVQWQSLGPRPMTNNHPQYNIYFGSVSGRVDALAASPAEPDTLLLGAATGGIWKSTDGGANWRPVSDTAPALAISHITYSRSNAKLVFAATGEVDSADLEYVPSRSQGTYLGAGLLRSVDGGETWTRIDVDLPLNSVLSRVLVHPSDPQRVLVGIYLAQDLEANVQRPAGLYRSTDGGVHFMRVLRHAVTDLVQDPNDPDTVFVGLGAIGGCATCEDESGVWRSTDFGATLAPSLIWTTPGATFDEQAGNVKLAVAGVKPTVLFASVLDKTDAHVKGGLYRTTDAGITWEKRAADGSMCPDPGLGFNQCSYDHALAVDPRNPNTIFLGTVDLYKSTDGAATWRRVTNYFQSGGTLHPDHHALLYPPGSPGTLLIAGDGGVYRTPDGGTTFEPLNDTLTLAQANVVALHPTDPLFFMSGTQDNGNIRFRNSFTWSDRTAGDGGFNLIQQAQPARILAANFYAYLNYSSNSGDSFVDATPGELMGDSGPKELMIFYPPAAAAPARPGLVFLGAQRLWVNEGFGCPTSRDPVSCTDWTPRSPILKANHVITAFDVLGDGSGPAWAALRCRSSDAFTCPATPLSGTVFFSADGGATWAERKNGLPGTIVTRIRAVSADGRSAYAGLGGYSGLPSRHVFRTTDAGVTWVNVSGNLPDVPVSSLVVDPGDANGIFVGTDVGVFRTTDGGASWATFNLGLPNASVYDLAFHPVTGDLVAATYGRGVYRVSPGGVSPIAPSPDFSFAPRVPAPGQSVAFTDRSVGGATSYQWDFGDGSLPSSEASPRHTFGQPGLYNVLLTVTNAAGSGTKLRQLVVTQGTLSPVTLQVPVVLDVSGVPPSHFTSDLVAVNRSGAESRLTISFTDQTGARFPPPGPKIGETLVPGRELRIPDVIAYLRANGYAIPATGVVGTLRLTFEDVADASLVFAGSRTSTPNPSGAVGGTFGLFAPAAAIGAFPQVAVIPGLREDEAFRSNLAIEDVPGGTGPPTLSIQLYDGETGQAAGAPTAVSLAPGAWQQYGSVLAASGTRNGYAVVTKTGGGSDAFLAYGVVNDGPRSGGGTSDGSFLGADASSGLVPIVLRVNSAGILFTSELILTNPTASATSVTLTYTPAPGLGGGAGGTAILTLPARRQLRRADAIAYLRDELHLPLLPGDVNQGGTLLVSGASAYVRTSNPNPDRTVGGTFGLAYPAVPQSLRARSEAWIHGLVQDGATRSNLAIADARVGDPGTVTYVVDVFDAVFGDVQTPRHTAELALAGGQWAQLTQVLKLAGLSNGHVRVRPKQGTSDFVVYGVLNDGGNPGERTSDGSYVAMSGVR